MDSNKPQDNADEVLKEQFAQLPPVVQKAITGAEVEGHLRKLSEKHRLHLDQWQVLENEVIMTLMGLQPTEELEANIKKEVNVDDTTAQALARDISLIVFDPIRKELERQLDHPQAEPPDAEPIEDLRMQVLENHQRGVSADTPIERKQYEEVAANPGTQMDVGAEVLEENTALPEVTSEAAADTSEQATGSAPAEPTTHSPTVKRGTLSGEYSPGVPSHERHDVESDPYRESVE